ncbi:hypothetical protein APHNP_0691 [Anaplasma phagocytophilum str. ApNP]|uniref:Uncharacterized protein n=1 Tax=Anaplasma phagocytophilum str. ApNP TaxID=1359153 RepID=A0A0F3NER1_ANAPH|nr:hypothetical protein APHNP_0691 [Anaplasma phagocytophilum str. ApNP]
MDINRLARYRRAKCGGFVCCSDIRHKELRASTWVFLRVEVGNGLTLYKCLSISSSGLCCIPGRR